MPINRDGISEKKPESDINDSKKAQKEIQFTSEKPKYKLKEIILPEHLKDQVHDVISAHKNQDLIFKTWGLEKVFKNMNKLGVNLYGPPGTGKTMEAHAIVEKLGNEIICMNYSEIESKFVGETSKNLSRLSDYAKRSQGIIFFDEADAMLSKRVTNMSSSTDASVNQTRYVLLTLLNDYDGMTIFATNFIENFEEAFMRRVQFHFKFELPDEETRKLLWKQYIPMAMPANVDFDKLANLYANVSGSDISNAVLMTAFKWARLEIRHITTDYFEASIKSVLKSKQANKGATVTKRTVSEEYVNQQLGKDSENLQD